MKRTNRIIALTAVLLVSCAATFALTKYEQKKEEIQNTDAVILEIPIDTVEILSWNYENQNFAFHKTDDIWIYDDDEAFPVSAEKISDILSQFENFGASFIIEKVEDYAQYGLEDPEAVIEFSTSDQTYQIRLGAFSKMDEQRYVDIGDGNVYLVKNDPVDTLESELSGMILHDETPSLQTVQELTFNGEVSEHITYVEESKDSYTEKDVYFAERDNQALPLDTSTVTNYLNVISRLELHDYVTYNATEEELESYGMNEPDLSIQIAYTEIDEDDNETEAEFILHISSDPEELQAAKDAEAKAQTNIPAVSRYVRVGDSQIVYELTETTYDKLLAASYDDLRHKEVFWAETDQITQIQIELEDETHLLSSEYDEKEDTRTWYYEEEEQDVSNLINTLKGLKADSFTDALPEQKEEIALTVSLDNEAFPEVTMEFYRYDGSFCLAVVNGESVSLVARSAVINLIESAQTMILN